MLRGALMLVAAVLSATAERVVGQESVTISLQGKESSKADVILLRDAAKTKSDEQGKVDPATEQSKALKTAYDAQALAASQLVRLLEQIDGLSLRESELTQALEREKGFLNEWSGRLKEPLTNPTATEEELRSVEAEAERCRNEATLAQGKAHSAEDQVKARKARVERIAEEFAANQKEREAIQARLSATELTPAQREPLELDALTQEMRQRLIELSRDKNPVLLRQDEQEWELARAQVAVAEVRNQVVQRRLDATRAARERALQEERRQKEAEAEQKRLDAARESHPLRRGVTKLEGLRAELQGLRAEEEAIRKGLERRIADRSADIALIETRNAAIEERLPKGSQLDEIRTAYLKDQAARLQVREVRAQGNLVEVLSRVPSLLQRMQERGDAVVALLDAMDDEELPAGEMPTIPSSSKDPLTSRWHDAAADHREGLAAKSGPFGDQFIASLSESWRAVALELRDLGRERRVLIGAIEGLADADLAACRKAVSLLRKRRSHLESVSFWLREARPFDAEELRRAGSEFARATVELPKSLASYARITTRDFRSPREILAILCLITSVGLVLGRRFANRTKPMLTDARRDPFLAWAIAVTRAFMAALPSILLAIASILLTGSFIPAAPADFFVQVLLCLFAFAWMSGAYLRATRQRSVEGEPPPRPHSARRLHRAVMVGLLILVPLIGWCDRAAAPALSQLLWLAMTIGVVLVAAGVARRREVLDLFLPDGDGAPWSRLVRAAVRILWPILVVVGVGVAVLQAAGFQNASRIIGTRTLLTLAVLIGSNFVFLVLSALVASRTRARPLAEDVDEEQEEWLNRRRRLTRRFLNVLLFVAVVTATLMALRWSLQLSNEAVGWLTSFVVIEGGDGGSHTRVGDLLRGTIVFILGLVGGVLFREFLFVGFRPADEDRQGTRYARGTLVFYLMIGLGTILGLRALRINLGDLGWLLAPAGVAIGFGMTELLSNFVSGLILFVERPVRVGDVVTVGDIEGDVKAISIRATVVRTRSGISIIIPNRRLIEENVINWSHGEARTRLSVKVGVSYGTDAGLVKKVLLDVAKREGRVLERPRSEVMFDSFGDSQLSFELLVWLRTPDPAFRRRVLSDINSAIQAAFDRTGIVIPFPQRDIHVRSTPRRPGRQRDSDEEEGAE